MIPGLAAQIPDSPLVQWLHAADEADPGRSARRRRRHRGRFGRLVAQDAAGGRLLLDRQRPRRADALDVRRRAARRRTPSFVLDQGGKVSHFNYFSNERTAEAIVNALLHDSRPPGFRIIGPLSWAGESATGVRAAAPRRRGAAGSRRCPAVFVLPGILGSNLKVDGKRIWLGWRLSTASKRLEYDRARRDGVEPDGPIGMYLRRPDEVLWRRRTR